MTWSISIGVDWWLLLVMVIGSHDDDVEIIIIMTLRGFPIASVQAVSKSAGLRPSIKYATWSRSPIPSICPNKFRNRIVTPQNNNNQATMHELQVKIPAYKGTPEENVLTWMLQVRNIFAAQKIENEQLRIYYAATGFEGAALH